MYMHLCYLFILLYIFSDIFCVYFMYIYVCTYLIGREIDEQLKMDQRVKTLAANVAIEAAQKKKENPYLAHKTVVPGTASVVPGLASVPGMAGQLLGTCMYICVCKYNNTYIPTYTLEDLTICRHTHMLFVRVKMYILMYIEGLVPEIADDRLPVAPRRDLRGKKGLKFVEAGNLASSIMTS